MAAYPVHIAGTPAQLPWKSIATFPVGTFLENIAVRANGNLLVTSMLAGEIFLLDPNAEDPQSTVRKLHTFASESSVEAEGEAGAYGDGMLSTAIVEDTRTADVFYAMAGKHGQAGTWAVYRLDLRGLDQGGEVAAELVARVPWATWLNGATFLPTTSQLLMAESLGGRLSSCDVDTGRTEIWLEDALVGKSTDRPPWPGVNGVQYYHGHVYLTNSDRALLLRAQVDLSSGKYVERSLEVLAEGCCGDDLAFDAEGNAYVTTNPQQTVLRFFSADLNAGKRDAERFILVGSATSAETAGPTAVAFGRTSKDEKSLYVVTTGGIVEPVGDAPGVARVIRVDVGIKGAA